MNVKPPINPLFDPSEDGLAHTLSNVSAVMRLLEHADLTPITEDGFCGLSLIHRTVADALEAAAEQADRQQRKDPAGKGRVPIDMDLAPEIFEKLRVIAEANDKPLDEQALEIILEQWKERRKPRLVT
ncbi:hypothetical protein [Thiorhodococcus minor]|uniref:Uncharacterized protein n=1 Tax=Thiorhodococcus minor TaxID=57489 RepID=A0A6M0K2X5_9GAMM|nr:hypothetical protein [Thiorhodococcus minor]NEV64126.1 hypothetical protein [Thiorhodococcus minor]